MDSNLETPKKLDYEAGYKRAMLELHEEMQTVLQCLEALMYVAGTMHPKNTPPETIKIVSDAIQRARGLK